jgi:hypothetical protein
MSLELMGKVGWGKEVRNCYFTSCDRVDTRKALARTHLGNIKALFLLHWLKSIENWERERVQKKSGIV